MLLIDYSSIRGEYLSDYSKNYVWNLFLVYIDTHSQRLIYEYPVNGAKDISIIQPQCANITFAYQSLYNRLFLRVIHKEVWSEINYIKRFHNAKALKFSVKIVTMKISWFPLSQNISSKVGNILLRYQATKQNWGEKKIVN